jgi:glutathione S-transferase
LKGVGHERRALVPGYHMAVALALTRGRCYTSPILELDGLRIGDSTAIIRALEERYPQPALYPAEPVERNRALELEDFFDEELGPYIRRLVFHELRSHRAGAARLASQVSSPPMKRFPRLSAEYFLAGTALRYGAGSAKAAERGQRRVLRALDRLEAELGANDYLVGERFTVADLTAASLFYPGAARRGAAADGPVRRARALSRAAKGTTRVPLGREDVSPSPSPRARRCHRAAGCRSAGLVGARGPNARRLVSAPGPSVDAAGRARRRRRHVACRAMRVRPDDWFEKAAQLGGFLS